MIIYLITNKLSGKKYVGQKSKMSNFSDYWGSGMYIRNAIKKYGKENFNKTILEDNIPNQKELNERERYWIVFHNTIYPNGYNLSSGGEGMSGFIHSEDTKRKIGIATSIALKGKKLSNVTKKKISQKLTGITRPESTRKKISKARQGMKFSYEHIENMRLSRLGKKHTEEHRRKIGDKSRGRKLSLDTQRKMSIVATERMKNVELRKQISNTLRGHEVSQETRSKIRASLQRTRNENKSSNNTGGNGSTTVS